MIVAGVWTGVGFSNLKNCWNRTGPGFQNFGTGAESESEKVTPATFDPDLESKFCEKANSDPELSLIFDSTRSLRGLCIRNFLSKNIDVFRLHQWFPESKQESDSKLLEEELSQSLKIWLHSHLVCVSAFRLKGCISPNWPFSKTKWRVQRH